MNTVKNRALCTEFKKLVCLVKRNSKCYFLDKFAFLISLLTPFILLVLFVTFLRNVYVESIKTILVNFQEPVNEDMLGGFTTAWLLSSILGVSSFTVAICANSVMIDDKISGTVYDFAVTPVKPVSHVIAYFISNFIVTTIVMISVLLLGFIVLAFSDWQLTASDVVALIGDVLLNVLFGTLLSAVVEHKISTQGGLSAISSLVSSMYGFVCGAYMPLSQFSEGLRNVLACLPGTHGVATLRLRLLGSYVENVCDNAQNSAIRDKLSETIKTTFDMQLKIGDNIVSTSTSYLIVFAACAALLVAFISIVIIENKRKCR